MTVLRLEALDVLAECIGNRVPVLKGNICAGPAEHPHKLEFPSLAIEPIRFRYFPDQAAIEKNLGATQVLMHVGRHEGTVQLRLGAKTHRQRAALEHEVLQLFLEQVGRPGVLVTPVRKCHDAIVAWELDTDEWENEYAYDKKWYSMIAVACQLPALITRGSVHTLEEIRVSLSNETGTQVETVSIDEDGCITAAAAP